jgi:endonuclease-3
MKRPALRRARAKSQKKSSAASKPARAFKPAEAALFFDRLAEANPDPRGELDYINPYTLLVAVVLSAQATDAGVNKATEPLFKVADRPEKMLALGEERLRHYIRTIGLFNTKAKNIIALSLILA